MILYPPNSKYISTQFSGSQNGKMENEPKKGKITLICSLLFIVPLANTKYKYIKCRQRYKK